MIEKTLKNKQLILFDGYCNLCNSSVIKIIEKDNNNLFIFAFLQSDIGTQIISHFNIDSSKTDSIILVTSETNHYTKSSAALKIGKHFNGFWKLFQLLWIIPRPIRDFFYAIVAKNRYKWFEKKETCMVPSPEIKAKFIDN